MLVQLIHGGSGTLRTEYPALINLLAACFFPVGLLMLALTGQELLTAHLSEYVECAGWAGSLGVLEAGC
jgi:formate/nitrite transporter FocA (FNT family)